MNHLKEVFLELARLFLTLLSRAIAFFVFSKAFLTLVSISLSPGRHPVGSQELVLGLVATDVSCLLSIVGTLNFAGLELLLFETHRSVSECFAC